MVLLVGEWFALTAWHSIKQPKKFPLRFGTGILRRTSPLHLVLNAQQPHDKMLHEGVKDAKM
jgi:hypothetical protein